MSFQRAFILWIPSLITGPSRNTAAWVCIVFCMASLMVEVLMSPSLKRRWSMFATLASPALSEIGLIASPGLLSAAMVLAQARPKMTRSRRELAPSLLAPCTDELPTAIGIHSESLAAVVGGDAAHVVVDSGDDRG